MPTKSQISIPEELPLSFSAIIRIAWQLTKGFKRYVWWVTLCYLLPFIILGIIIGEMQTHFPIITTTITYQVIVDVITAFMAAPLVAGVYYMAQQWIQGKVIRKGTWLKGFRYTLPVGLVILLTQLIGGLATMLRPYLVQETFTWFFIINYIVSLVINFLLVFAPFFIFDKGKNFLAACWLSSKLFISHLGFMVGIYLFILVLIILSCIPLFIGLIWTLPLLTLVNTVIYQKLINNDEK